MLEVLCQNLIAERLQEACEDLGSSKRVSWRLVSKRLWEAPGGPAEPANPSRNVSRSLCDALELELAFYIKLMIYWTSEMSLYDVFMTYEVRSVIS